MADALNRIYIPKRLYARLKSIYESNVTVIAAPDGVGSSTYITEFILRSRTKGYSCKYVRGCSSAAQCFSMLCKKLVGKEFRIPVSDVEQIRIKQCFSDTENTDKTVVVLDNEYAADMLFNNARIAKLLAEECGAKIVVTAPPLSSLRTRICRRYGFDIIDESELLLSKEETAEYAAPFTAAADRIDEIYRLSGGSVMRARICLRLISTGHELPEDGADLLTEYFRKTTDPQEQAALLTAVSFDYLSDEYCAELRASKTITDILGKDTFEPSVILDIVERLNKRTGLVSVNRKTRRVYCHPLAAKVLKERFLLCPAELQREFRLALARHWQRTGNNFNAFLQYYCLGDFKNAGLLKNNINPITFNDVLNTKQTLLAFVEDCPLDCKEIITRYIRVVSLLLMTDMRDRVKNKLTEAAAYVSSCDAYSESEKRSLLAYIHLHRTHEDYYLIEKMGTHIKRAYELFSGEKITVAPFYSWHLYTPSVFALIHRYSMPVATEEEQFVRYHRMYSDMIMHGEHICELYTAEALYFRGEFAQAAASVQAGLNECTEKHNLTTKISFLTLKMNVCLFRGDFRGFYEAGRELADVIHQEDANERGIMARLCLTWQAVFFGDPETDGSFLRDMSDSTIMLNRFQAPFIYYLIAVMDVFAQDYRRVLAKAEKYLEAARDVRSETIEIKLLLLTSYAALKSNDTAKAANLAEQALDKLLNTEIITPAAELLLICSEMRDFMIGTLPSRYYRYINKAELLAAECRRGIEVIQTFLLTLAHPISRHSEISAAYIYGLADSAGNRRQNIGLSKKEFACAVLAASKYTNSEIMEILSLSEDSVKSCLKRAFAKLGVRSRTHLKTYVPTIER